MIERNDDCWCKSGKKWKKCHYPQTSSEDTFAQLAQKYNKQWGIMLKNPEQIEGIRKAGYLTAAILDEVCSHAKEGITTNELDAMAFEKIIAAHAKPASLGYGYPPFPKTLCTSLNEVICHGIPNDVPLKNGDIVNIDLALIKDGFFGDCSKMVAIGPVSPSKKLVFDTSLACLLEAAKRVRPGAHVCEIGDAIYEVAQKAGCSVVTQFVGHGVGIKYHEQPQIPHGKNHVHIPLVPGMTFTIEPMINAGVFEAVIDPIDQWTARTRDGQPSAQWEHTFVVTNDGYEIVTPWTPTTCEVAKE